MAGEPDEAAEETGDADLRDLLLSASQALDVVGQVSDYAIFALDPHGTIESWNLGAERAKGYTAAEAIGQNIEMFYEPQDREDGLPMRLLARAAARGRVEHTGWRLRKDGSRFWADVLITAVRNRSGKLTGFTKITRDRSEVKALEDAQDAFYAAFTHDFKTPIESLLGQLELLRDAEGEQRDRLIDRADGNARRLMTMVEELVTFARQRARRGAVPTADLDVASVARHAVRDLPDVLHPERVQMNDDVIALARANGTALHRALTNLLVNALKYSSPDTPVWVRITDHGRDGVRIEVEDQGRGIHAGDLDTIFDDFQRGRLAEDDGGTGLGLTSARQLVQQQGGTISIDSEEGIGTTVTVHLEAVPVILDSDLA